MTNRYSLKTASFRGVNLRLHISLLLMLAYIVVVTRAQFSLVLGELDLEPGQVGFGPWMWGFLFALGLLISLGAHEIGHIIMARRLGGKLRAVTLWLLGGTSEFAGGMQRSGSLKVALVGPLVSLVIGSTFLFIAGRANSPNLILAMGWLGSINIVIALFNILPAFPFDCGRAVQELRGTETAARISKGVAVVLGVLGFLGLNLVLVLTAAAVYVATRNELAASIERPPAKRAA